VKIIGTGGVKHTHQKFPDCGGGEGYGVCVCEGGGPSVRDSNQPLARAEKG